MYLAYFDELQRTFKNGFKETKRLKKIINMIGEQSLKIALGSLKSGAVFDVHEVLTFTNPELVQATFKNMDETRLES